MKTRNTCQYITINSNIAYQKVSSSVQSKELFMTNGELETVMPLILAQHEIVSVNKIICFFTPYQEIPNPVVIWKTSSKNTYLPSVKCELLGHLGVSVG